MLKVDGTTVKIIASANLDDLKMLTKYNPDAMTIKNEDDEIKFRVATGDNTSVSKFGITFSEATASGKAIARVHVYELEGAATPEEVVDIVTDKFEVPVTMLEEVMAKVPGEIAAVKAKREAFRDKIQIVED